MRIVEIEPIIRDLTAMKTELGVDALLIDAMIEGLESKPVIGTADVLRGMWISVNDRLPETAEIYNENSEDEFSLSNPVLTVGENGFAVAKVERDGGHEIFIDSHENEIDGITHWMPLPELPEEDNP